jgi:hypothetical protein
MAAVLNANKANLVQGLVVIELMQKLNGFIKFSGKPLEKARLAKIVLSNPVLQGGSLRYGYEKPFDDLLELTNRKIWWPHQETPLRLLPPRTRKGARHSGALFCIFAFLAKARELASLMLGTLSIL